MSRNITKKSCAGCQWEDNCEFDCPCDFHSGRDTLDNEESYRQDLRERAKKYSTIINEFAYDN